VTAPRRAWEGLLDLIYPPTCLLCGAWDEPLLCASCVAGFAPVPEPLCPACGHPTEPGVICRLCTAAADHWGGWAFTHVRGAGLHRGTLRYALHQLKYRKKEALGLPLGAWLANRSIAEGLLEARPQLVVALPMPAAKERTRGYNQAQLLAAPVAEQAGVPLLPKTAFQRVRYESVQMTLGAAGRASNLSPDDFIVTDTAAIAGKRLLLIDDVMTTGATLHTAAACLRQAGAAQVDALVLSLG